MKRGDLVLIAVALVCVLAGGAWWLHVHGAGNAEDGLVVVCQTKDGFYQVDKLAADAEYTVSTPGTGAGADADGGKNTVRIADGRVQVVESNCSNQVCVKHDAIDAAGEQIVCLPHGLVVQIAASEDDVAPLQ